MSITKSDVQTIASLAQLDVDGDMLDHYAKELSHIFEMIQEMQTVDTEAIDPMPHPQDIVLRLRADEVTETEERDSLQAIAPQTSEFYYLVPKVLK